MNQDKHVVIVHTREDRDIFINKLKYSKTIYHPDVEDGKAEPGDIIVDKKQCMDWIFCQYIIDNYDNLHEYTIFCQANPFDHVHEPLLALDVTFKGGYGSLCYARSFYDQYTTAPNWQRYHPVSLVSQMINLNFINENNILKNIYYSQCGVIFFAHRDNIRQRPKSFYQNIIDCDNDELLLEKYINHNPPKFFLDFIDKKHPHLKLLSTKEKLLATYKKNKRDDFFGHCIEPLWMYILCDQKLFNKFNLAQASLGNLLHFNTASKFYDDNFKVNSFPYTSSQYITGFNFKKMENDWFDFSCPNYIAWRKTLIKKTIDTGKELGFNGRQYIDQLEKFGIKHISL